MPAVALAAVAAGIIALYSALTGQSPVDETIKAIRSGRLDGSAEGRRALIDDKAAKSPQAARGGGDGAVASTSSNPCASMPVPDASQLVSIGGGHKLRADAAAALERARQIARRPIGVTDSFRTYAQQADCHRRKPGVCAPPGKSCHEKGLAIDVIDMNDQRVIAALTATGWVRYAPDREPWHWSFGVRG